MLEGEGKPPCLRGVQQLRPRGLPALFCQQRGLTTAKIQLQRECSWAEAGRGAGRETVFPPWARLPTRAAAPDPASEAEAHLIVYPSASHSPSCSATGSRLKTDNSVQDKSAARASQKRSPLISAPRASPAWGGSRGEQRGCGAASRPLLILLFAPLPRLDHWWVMRRQIWGLRHFLCGSVIFQNSCMRTWAIFLGRCPPSFLLTRRGGLPASSLGGGLRADCARRSHRLGPGTAVGMSAQ